MTELQQLMAALDLALTGKDSSARHGFKNAEAWLTDSERAWYLSDGGYSRVMVSDDIRDPHLFLSSVSRREVFERWDAALPQRRAVESLIRRELAQYIQDV